jgi:hypothetical protein
VRIFPMRIKRIFVAKEVVLLKSVSYFDCYSGVRSDRTPTVDWIVTGVEGPVTGG